MTVVSWVLAWGVDGRCAWLMECENTSLVGAPAAGVGSEQETRLKTDTLCALLQNSWIMTRAFANSITMPCLRDRRPSLLHVVGQEPLCC